MKDHLLRLSSALLIVALATTGCILGSSDDPESADPVVPEVVNIDPADGAIHVSRWDEVELRFSVAMDETSVENATTVTTPDKAAVSFEASWYGNTMELSFDDELAAETVHTVNIGVGATSTGDVPLAEAFTASFTTLPSHPVVTDNSPTDGATDVALNARPWILFSTWMNSASVEAATSVDPAAPYTLIANGDEFTLEFDSALDPATLYTITVAGTAEDGWGTESMGDDFVFSFTTGTEVDDTPPSIVSFDPPNGAVGVGRDIGQIVITFSEPIPDMPEPDGLDLRLYNLVIDDPEMSPDGTVMTLPLYRLPAGCELWVDLSPFMDMVGNVSDDPPVYSFTTAGTADLFPAGENDWWLYFRDYGDGSDDYVNRVENISGSSFDMARYRQEFHGGRDIEDYTVLDEARHYNRTGGVLSWTGVGEDDEGTWEENGFTPPVEWLHFPLSTGTAWDGVSQFDMDGENVRVSYAAEVLSVDDLIPGGTSARGDRTGWISGRSEGGYSSFPDCAEVQLNFTVETQIEGFWETIEEGVELSYYCPGLGLVYRQSEYTEYGEGEPQVGGDETYLEWWLVGQ